MAKWKEVENDVFQHVQNTYGDKCICVQNGKSNSKTSDILIIPKSKTQFNIDTKMPKSQCCQMVIIPDHEKKTFQISEKHQGALNKYTDEIQEFMNEHFDEFCNPSTKSLIVNIDNALCINYIKSEFEHKNVKCIIVKNKKDFIVVPIHRIEEYFETNMNYRIKKSGSGNPSKKNVEEIKELLKGKIINYEIKKEKKKTYITTSDNIDGLKLDGVEEEYFFKQRGTDTYVISKASHTANPNVICSLTLKKDAPPSDTDYLNSLIY